MTSHRDSLFTGIVSIAAEAIIATDAEFRVIVFNAGAERIFGFAAEEVIGRPLDVLLPARFREVHALHMRRFAQSGVSARRMGERQQISGVRKSGEEFPAEASILQLREDQRTIFTVVLRDVTEQRRTEARQRFLATAGEALADSLEYGRTLERIVWMPVPVLGEACVVDLLTATAPTRSVVAHIDRALEETLREMRRRFPPILEGTHPLAEVVRDRRGMLLNGENISRGIARAATEEHGEMLSRLAFHSAVLVPLVARDRAIGVLSIFRTRRSFEADDLAFAEDFARIAALAIENAHLHEEVQRAVRARDEMLGLVSHDLRNPVQAIKMLTSAAARAQPRLPEETREELALIRGAAEQMDELIQALLDVTRIEAGRLYVAPAAVGPAELVDVALRHLAPLAAERSIRLERDVPSSLPAVAADSARVTQVLSNLVGNSLKFTEPGGRVEVAALANGVEVEFSVRDNGQGVPPDQLPHVFDRFWQSRRSGQSGAGLGLAIARGIVEAHGGRMWLESEVGVGTAAHFTLPIAGDNVPARPSK